MTKHKPCPAELNFPPDMPSEVQKTISQQLAEWENTQQMQEAVEGAEKFNAKELDQLNSAIEGICVKLGIDSDLESIVNVITARADRVATALVANLSNAKENSKGG